MSASDIAQALGRAQREGRNWRCNCPIHGGHSLTLADGRGGRLLITCHGNNCDRKEILAELRRRRLLPELEPRRNSLDIVATYDYRDADGALLSQVCRLDPKSFRQRRPDGQGWKWSTKGVRMVLYRLPELVAARDAANGQPPRVYVCEGEKDVDRLRTQWGLLATTNPMGAAKSGKWRGEFNPYLAGFDVVILPDNDAAGRAHAQQIVRNLAPVAASIRILELPGLPEGGDVSDWLDRNPDATQSDFETLAEDCAAHLTPGSASPTTASEALEGTEDEVALEFSNRHTTELRHVNLWHRWLRWDGVGWRHIDDLSVFHRVRVVAREFAKRDNDKKLGRDAAVAAVERLARNDPRHDRSSGIWDLDHEWFATPPITEA